ncbi:MAG TPA: hypothetical protein VH107_15640 [Lacipirellulaceae bacterium]|nr:hypothetical protein [Lacipirellulaceae bacterium]
MKSIMNYALAFAACCALASPAFAAKGAKGKHADSNKQHVKIEISGVDSSQAEAINKALADHSLSARVHEGKGKKSGPMSMNAEVDRGSDLNEWAKALSTVESGKTPPMLQVVLYAPLTSENSKAVLGELEKVKGVDIKHSSTDVAKGEVHVALNGTDHVTLDDINSAMQAANVTSHYNHERKSKTT